MDAKHKDAVLDQLDKLLDVAGTTDRVSCFS